MSRGIAGGLNCEFYKDGVCEVASKLAGREVVVLDIKACHHCITDDHPQVANRVTASLAISSGETTDEKRRLTKQLRKYIPQHAPIGVGSHVSRILWDMNFRPEEGCPCTEHAKAMNENGIEWCQQNVPTIVGWLEEEAKRRGYVAILAKLGGAGIVYTAISRAKKAKQDYESLRARQNDRIAKKFGSAT